MPNISGSVQEDQNDRGVLYSGGTLEDFIERQRNRQDNLEENVESMEVDENTESGLPSNNFVTANTASILNTTISASVASTWRPATTTSTSPVSVCLRPDTSISPRPATTTTLSALATSTVPTATATPTTNKSIEVFYQSMAEKTKSLPEREGSELMLKVHQVVHQAEIEAFYQSMAEKTKSLPEREKSELMLKGACRL